MKTVILSTPLLLTDCVAQMETITKEQALEFMKTNPINYCGHETVKILGIEPSRTREVC